MLPPSYIACPYPFPLVPPEKCRGVDFTATDNSVSLTSVEPHSWQVKWALALTLTATGVLHRLLSPSV